MVILILVILCYDETAPIAMMMNSINQPIDCTATALTIAATERGVGSDLNAWADCSGAKSVSAW